MLKNFYKWVGVYVADFVNSMFSLLEVLFKNEKAQQARTYQHSYFIKKNHSTKYHNIIVHHIMFIETVLYFKVAALSILTHATYQTIISYLLIELITSPVMNSYRDYNVYIHIHVHYIFYFEI